VEGAGLPFPSEFFLDLTLSVGGDTHFGDTASITGIQYASLTDEWTITIESDAISDSFVAVRRPDPEKSSEGAPRKAFGSFSSVLSFAPGRAWDDLSITGADSGSLIEFSPDKARIHPQRIIPNPDTFDGFRIVGRHYGTDGIETFSAESVVPNLAERHSIKAGYNIGFDDSSPGQINIRALPGDGEGLVPCEEDCAPVLRFLSGATPNNVGNVEIQMHDCLRVNMGDAGGGNQFLQLASDCLPCCDCHDYNAVSLAISRQSAKLFDINEELIKATDTVQANYDLAIQAINAQSPGLIIIHSVLVYPTRVYFYVQNISSVPAYALLSIEAAEGVNVELIIPSPGVMEGLQLTNPPLTGLTPTGNDTSIFVPDGLDGWVEGAVLGTIGSASGGPLQAGEQTRVGIVFPDSEAVITQLVATCEGMEDLFQPIGQEKSQLFLEDSELQGPGHAGKIHNIWQGAVFTQAGLKRSVAPYPESGQIYNPDKEMGPGMGGSYEDYLEAQGLIADYLNPVYPSGLFVGQVSYGVSATAQRVHLQEFGGWIPTICQDTGESGFLEDGSIDSANNLTPSNDSDYRTRERWVGVVGGMWWSNFGNVLRPPRISTMTELNASTSGGAGLTSFKHYNTCEWVWQRFDAVKSIQAIRVFARKAEIVFSRTVGGETVATPEEIAVFTRLRHRYQLLWEDFDSYYSAMTFLASKADRLIADLIPRTEEAITAYIVPFMASSLMPEMTSHVATIYGNLNFGCRPFNHTFTLTPESTEDLLSFSCVAGLVDLHRESLGI
jgi:hypothetical protein